MIIDATNLILGRMATVAAKKALLGEEVNVINCEKAVVTGEKSVVLMKYRRMRELGAPLVGPYYPKGTERIVRRTIRGMLPYKQPKGAEAYKRVKCYKGVPKDFEGKKAITIKEADVSKVVNTKYQTVEQISKFLGGKQ